MAYIILAIGVAVALIGLGLAINPKPIIAVITRNMDSMGFFFLALGLRLVMGIALLLHADASRFPKILTVIGWVAIGAAVIMGVMGAARFRKMIAWELDFAAPFVRVAGILAVAAGAFFVYAVI